MYIQGSKEFDSNENSLFSQISRNSLIVLSFPPFILEFIYACQNNGRRSKSSALFFTQAILFI